MFGGEYNPDNLDYTYYNSMMEDPQIKGAMNLLTYTLLKQDWTVTPATTNPEDVEVADFITRALENMVTPMRLVRKDLYTNTIYGYAVGEVVYTLNSEGKVVPKAIKSLPIESIEDCFEYDDDGTVKTVWQLPPGSEAIEIPGWKCMINTFDETFMNKYGHSLLNPVYDNYFMKSKILRWYAIFLEKHSLPTLLGKRGEAGNIDKIKEQIDAFGEGSVGGVIEKDDEIMIMESGKDGTAFTSAINYHDAMIHRTFMIGSLLLGQVEAKGGSLAQSGTHFDVFRMFCEGIHEDAAIPWQELVKRLVDYNYTVEEYPRFGFESFEEKDLLELLKALEPYAQNFLIDVQGNWFDEFIRAVMLEYADVEIEEDTNATTGQNTPEPTPVEVARPLEPVPLPEGSVPIADKIKELYPTPKG
jgi:hypothetical protein